MPTPATAIPVREIALVAVLAVAIYVLLSIGSYSPFDPAWTVAGSDLARRAGRLLWSRPPLKRWRSCTA